VKLYEQTNIYDFHKTSIDNLLYITKPFPLLITAAKDDNMLHLWDLSHGHSLTCRKVASIKHVDKNKVFIDNLVKSMGKGTHSLTHLTIYLLTHLTIYSLTHLSATIELLLLKIIINGY